MIDRRGTKANFNSDSKPYEVSASLCIAGERLFAAWRVITEEDLLNNSGETPNALFKTGGCLDLMLQTDTDQRLLITLVKGQPRAVLYRVKVPDTAQPVAFSSPWRTIHIDSVEDITAQVTLATAKRPFRNQRPPRDAALDSEIQRPRPRRYRRAAREPWPDHAARVLGQQSHRHHRRCPQRSRAVAQLGQWKLTAE